VSRRLSSILSFIRQQAGQGLAEYALILALIAIIAIISLMFLGSQISDKLSIVGDAV
jgi:pilus assembly protein Flp/PilA